MALAADKPASMVIDTFTERSSKPTDINKVGSQLTGKPTSARYPWL
jgi:hypothetical protein